MNQEIADLVDKYFEKTIVIRDLDNFNKKLSSINTERQKSLSIKEIKSIFQLILDNLEYFKSVRISIDGLKLSNLFKYTYDAKFENGKCYAGSVNRKKITKDLYYIIQGVGFFPVNEIFEDTDNKIDFSQRQLKELIGLKNIKKEIEALTALAKIRKQKKDKGIPVTPNTLHMIFSGNPGTGKTTVARLIGAIYKDIGLLENGQIIEVGREDIVAEYIGHTAKNVKELFKRANGGVLFIDEAYSLNYSDSERDFGKEAINTLVKLMEVQREELVIILAGYKKEMKDFLSSNPGLESRFSWYIDFEDYSLKELFEIYNKMLNDIDHILTDGAKFKLEIILEELKNENKLEGNARSIRNIFERTFLNQSKRLSKVNNPSELQLRTIVPEDIPEK